MLQQLVHTRPLPWREYPHAKAHPLIRPLHWLNWCTAWAAWALGNWALLHVLEYLGAFSVLIAVIFYFSESGDRLKQKHYQAWQVINTAQGKGGSGGRIDALQELNHDHVPLVGVDASSAFLQGIRLPDAMLSRCDLHASDLRDGGLHGSAMSFCNLRSANLRQADLSDTQLADADLSDADLSGANLTSANLARSNLDNADLRGANLKELAWKEIGSLRLANVFGIRNAPEGFAAFAMAHGAVSAESDADWQKMQANAPSN
jgi:Pentapeptide repeats (8 copies)